MKVKLINSNIKSNYSEELLKSRGIENLQEFLNPTEANLQDWRDIENIEKGVAAIGVLSEGAKVALIVDCDVDGFTSAAIIGQYLVRDMPSINIEYFIHKGKAHGLEEHWEEIQNQDFELIILPDAGSNDSKYAEKMNCPVLIIDHHPLEDLNVASNMIIINNQISPKYKNKDLSGAGMAYQFCRAMDFHFGNFFAEDYIDLAALGICGDMMSGLEIENQYIWRQGFRNVKNYFFWSIAKRQAYSITGKTEPSDTTLMNALNPTTVAFYIVPLINAMVRVGTMDEKSRMLRAFIDGHSMTPSLKRGAKGTFEEVAIECVRECTNARSHQNKFKENAVAKLEVDIFNNNLLDNEVLFIRLDEEDEFPSELNGLIAMQLSQRYKKPTIVARLNSSGFVKGSIRGLSNSSLESFKDYLLSTGLFEYVQGHDNAAGCSIKNNDLRKFHETANKELANYNLGEKYYEVNFERRAMEKDLAELIFDLDGNRFIWSHKNFEPLIYVKDLYVESSDIQIMGKNKDTVKIFKNGISYMKFFAKDMIEELSKYNKLKLEIVGKANINEWNGNFSPQVFIESYEIKEDNLTDF